MAGIVVAVGSQVMLLMRSSHTHVRHGGAEHLQALWPQGAVPKQSVPNSLFVGV
jgi:hypothetical protein